MTDKNLPEIIEEKHTCGECSHYKKKGKKHTCVHPERKEKEYQVDPKANAIWGCWQSPDSVKSSLPPSSVKPKQKKKE